MDRLLHSDSEPIGLGIPSAQSASAIVDRLLGCGALVPSPLVRRSRLARVGGFPERDHRPFGQSGQLGSSRIAKSSECLFDDGCIRIRDKFPRDRCSGGIGAARNAHRAAGLARGRGPRVQRHSNSGLDRWSGSARASAGFPSSRPS